MRSLIPYSLLKTSLLTLFLFFSVYVNAQENTSNSVKVDSIAKRDGFFFFPLFYYTPDTRFASGIAGVYFFNTGKDLKTPNDTRLSYIRLVSDYSQNKQFDLWMLSNIFTNKEGYLFRNELRYRNFPDRFYGIGNDTPEEDVEFYAYDFYKFKTTALKQVSNKLFVGLDYTLENRNKFQLQSDGALIAGDITGYNGGLISALGTVISYDNRDNIVNAYSGVFLEAAVSYSHSKLGSDFNFLNANVVFSKYWEVKKNHIFCINAFVNTNFGETPFISLAKAGDDNILRGYARNRYRDQHFMGIQSEFRFPVWRRFGMVVFAGFGDVFKRATDLGLNRIKYSYGSGIRYCINTKERINFRFDYGFGRKNDAFYIKVAEAF